MKNVVLRPLDSACNPLLLNRIPHIELTATLLEVPGDASSVKSVGCCIDPVRDITLDELGGLFFYGHTREQISNPVVDGSIGILVSSVGCGLSPDQVKSTGRSRQQRPNEQGCLKGKKLHLAGLVNGPSTIPQMYIRCTRVAFIL